jgi:hypothetical protein
MDKLVFLLTFVIFVTGCTLMPKESKKFIIDSEYAKYEQRKAELERAYFNGEITYSEYQVKLDELEQDRLKKEQEREEILFR